MNKTKKFVKVSGDLVPEIYMSGMERDDLKKEFGKLLEKHLWKKLIRIL